jgi:hypothetical protein
MYMDVPVSSPRCYRTVGLSWRRERWLSSKALSFKDYVVSQLESPEIGGKAVVPDTAVRVSRKWVGRPAAATSATTTPTTRKATLSGAG